MPETAGRDDQMHRVAGEEDATVPVALGDQQMVTPGNDVADLEVAGEADQVADDRDEIGVGRQRRMQRELLAVALRDHAGAVGVGELIVAAFAGDDALVQVLGMEDHLDEIADAAAALQTNAQLLAHGGGAAVGAGEVVAAECFGLAGGRFGRAP